MITKIKIVVHTKTNPVAGSFPVNPERHPAEHDDEDAGNVDLDQKVSRVPLQVKVDLKNAKHTWKPHSLGSTNNKPGHFACQSTRTLSPAVGRVSLRTSHQIKLRQCHSRLKTHARP